MAGLIDSIAGGGGLIQLPAASPIIPAEVQITVFPITHYLLPITRH